MSEIVKKAEAPLTEWDPLRTFREMRDLLRWDPFREMTAMPAMPRAGWAPRFEVTETVDAFFFKADLPGVKKDEVEVAIAGNRLTISGKRDREEEHKAENVFTCEREFGSFVRAFTLPDTADVDHAKSELKDGVLTLVIPKKAGAVAKKITINEPMARS